jgi:hypothetical protein
VSVCVVSCNTISADDGDFLSVVLFFLWKLVSPSLARLSVVGRRAGIVTSTDNVCLKNDKRVWLVGSMCVCVVS